MNTNTCKNCRYFMEQDCFVPKHYIEQFPEIYALKGNEISGFCANPKIQSDSIDVEKYEFEIRDGLVATCDEQRAILRVGKDFGCIHFDRKDI